jgi:NAD(P)-dependent dehydrogenase (short-subunit alcohol dehydrogenase family)
MTATPIAVVTGANRGLGRSIVRALARSGHRVVAAHRPGSDIDPTLALLASEGADALPFALDLVDAGSHREAAARLAALLAGRWGATHLDLLVNNAGVGGFDPSTR